MTMKISMISMINMITMIMKEIMSMIVAHEENGGSNKALFQSIIKSISIVTSIPSIHYQPYPAFTSEKKILQPILFK